jgi:hypothetical protein
MKQQDACSDARIARDNVYYVCDNQRVLEAWS